MSKLGGEVGWAALDGNIMMLKWLNKKGCLWDSYTFASAALYGDLGNMMSWLKDNDCYWDEYTFRNAAEHGSLVNLKWLKNNGCPWNGRTFAAINGNIENLNWLHEK